MTNIEVESRGPLSMEDFARAKNFLEKNGRFKGENKRLSLMYFRNKFPKDMTEIKDEKVDLRIRVTNGQAELVLKYGTFSASDSRKEISIFFAQTDIEKYIDLLALLDWYLCVAYATKAYTFDYEGVEFGLIEIFGYGHNFEAEILTTEEKIPQAKEKIEQLLKSLRLKVFTQDEFDKQCSDINNQKGLQFDLSKQKYEEIEDKFSEVLK